MLQCLCSILLLQLVEVKLLSATPIEYMRGLSLRKGHKRGKTGKANIGIFLGYHLKSRLCGGNAYLVEHGMKIYCATHPSRLFWCELSSSGGIGQA